MADVAGLAAAGRPGRAGPDAHHPRRVLRVATQDGDPGRLLETAAEVMGPSGQAPALRLVDDLGREHRDLVVVLVSNNPYALDRLLARGTRPTLGTG